MVPASRPDPIQDLFSLECPGSLERSFQGAICCWQSPDKRSRFGLLSGDSGTNLLLTIGLNPSRADHIQADPTWTRIQKVAQGNGYEGVLLLNIYPQRATQIQHIHQKVKPTSHRLNMQFWEEVGERVPQADVWCAWGATLHHRPYLKGCLRELLGILSKNDYRYWSWGELLSTKHPRHPLSRGKYAFRYSDAFVAFDPGLYVKALT